MPGASVHRTPDHNVDGKPVHVSGQVSSQGVRSADPSPGEPTDPGRHTLGEHVVGQRVVVRRLLPGETGPTGGPAFTDTLGHCLAWDVTTRTCVLQGPEGPLSIPFDLIVSGKPVPPRPSIRLRVDVAEAESHVARLWQTTTAPALPGQEPTWVLRSTPAGSDGRLRKRGNSMLAVVPDVDAAAATAAARGFYAALGQPVLAATVPDSPAEADLLALGWEVLPDGASAMLVAPVSRAARRSRARGVPHPLQTEETESGASTRIEVDGQVVARGRAVLTGQDWVGIEDLWVDPDRRRCGHAHAVLSDLLDWAGSCGAMTAWLHVEADNSAARELYARLGFSEHHPMRYLSAPSA